ncbi:V [Mastadenovirus eidoli]|uniref:V n=1 Tax=Eidolon helvum adenovirus TaxID=2039267 RepID=A0A348FKG5_9ADEN|nr:V [Eidolon helvum adenovirus] [Eidolon helvum adenovirus]BBF72832.1 V [Eidolon helvum adenovirus] [Eidolon helvum adenovirus]
MSSRKIKEEMLEVIAPDIYKTKKFKSIKKKERDVKTKKKKSSSSDVEEVMYIPPPRNYRWTGRKVTKVARPGVVVTYTPGQRTGVTSKRPYDEVYADTDILEQAELKTGEFAYGKKPKNFETIIESKPPSFLKERSSVIKKAEYKPYIKPEPDVKFRDFKKVIKKEEVMPIIKKEDIIPIVKKEQYIPIVKKEQFVPIIKSEPMILKDKVSVIKKAEYKPYMKPEPGVKFREFKSKVKKTKDDDDVIEVGSFPSGRKYQWKGRKVTKVARPGVVITYTPNERSGPAIKRSADEIFTDTDILDQAERRENEFAYGKRQKIPIKRRRPTTDLPIIKKPKKEIKIEIKRPIKTDIDMDEVIETKIEPKIEPKVEPMEIKTSIKRSLDDSISIGKKRKMETFVPLSTHNPTPHLQPVTEQKIIPMFPENSSVQATGQVLASTRPIKKARSRKSEANLKVDLPINTSAGPAVVKTDVSVLPIEPVAPGVGVRTIDISIPEKMEIVQDQKPTSIAFSTPVPKVLKEVALTTSAPVVRTAPLQTAVVQSFKPMKLISAPPISSYTITEPKYVSKTITQVVKTPKTIAEKKTVSRRKYPPANKIIPVVRYHPSIKMPTAYKKKIIPKVRYHPSIIMP